ncbi:2-succinyl-5-enolpyruvyl-6-hydroxy-3-cyclohexene-1-carboxylic-acid synthase [Flagellimonas sp. HMM57]|uniref:2-succinyl-5-enolpyruvyl-6-hydroxy-3- cyclohexene-1-carboxylic-acid synthase n=1 Tax=unclassified Flagellimonas TaxID=2644544 RepID=UPI0013D825DA|nr:MULTISPECIES: 2-succinyl-5-enolpyruvyl-6-hydroxy-3-cyclohexene-1-carboxylic-acid synthase [unclassified Flagellimonas]UII76042.1 2-succinyl-5-enolpyruvyl-6-hydroxy-3-cyclohexene-1-carboxylic-acid synthase [Flagellimonas sp. HMM57]
MMYSNIPSAQTLVLYFKSRGIKNIVISPGSRNAPLTLGFTKNPFFNCFSIVDERCAGFFALGMAQQLREPVAAICTSGSALLNYYPAVAEAFYSDIPLIVVSADRPSYKIDVGDGQTIRQENVLERHIGYTANLKQDTAHSPDKVANFTKTLNIESQATVQAYNESEISNALEIAILKHAPVHINIPFEEPLYDCVETTGIEVPEFAKIRETEPGIKNWDTFIEIWNTSKRKMILVGVNHPNAIDKEVLESLADDDTMLVFTETTSNIHHPNFFPSIDSIIAPIEKSEKSEELFEALQPELLITFGGLIVSKKIKSFLRKYQPKAHWHIDTKKAYDTFFCLSEHIKLDANYFLRRMLNSNVNIESDYYQNWNKVKEKYDARREAYLNKIEFSDFTVFDQLQKTIPHGYQVHLANSSTIRYTQLFPMDASLKVFCNRGTSGIDGSTSTAMGASIHAKEPTLLITGDLSFFYDSNALWSSYIRPDFRIILINNSGGGIFRILPGKEETKEFATFFETEHGLTAKYLAKMYDLEYSKAENEKQLKNCLADFYRKSEHAKILEINTPRLQNDKILLSYFDFIS